jgi:imidazolonepropionase-like amidohydrolase
MITVPGGYPTGRNPAIAAPVRSAAEAAAKVATLVSRGARVIKIALLAEAQGRMLPTLTLEEVQAIVEEAHRHGRIVTAHVLEGRGLDLALRGGVDELAHMPCLNVTPAQLKTLAERRVPVVGTIHISRLFFRTQCPDALSNARIFVQAGGKLLYGTDIPGVVATLDTAELRLMEQAGLSPRQVLKAATAEAGQELGMAPLGSLVRGAPADLAVFNGDPTRNLRRLKRPLLVLARGTRVPLG